MELQLIACPTFKSLKISLTACEKRKARGRYLEKNPHKRQTFTHEYESLLSCVACKKGKKRKTLYSGEPRFSNSTARYKIRERIRKNFRNREQKDV